MKVVHLNHDSRASFGITEGLVAAGADLHCSREFTSLGKTVVPRSPDIASHFADCHAILVNDTIQFADHFDRHHLWHKVVFYDYRDSTELAPDTDQVALYFKRSLSNGPTRTPAAFPRPVVPINHCALDEYYPPAKPPTTYDVGCFFDARNPNLGSRRRATLEALLDADLPNSLVGASTCHGARARAAVTQTPEDNPFVRFRDLQARCRIVFTAQPEHVDGDNRTWEAFASGALVFRDLSHIPTPAPTLDGRHCVVFDALDPDSLRDALGKARYYLAHDDERAAIARNGFQHVLRHHRPLNRARRLLNRHLMV